MTNHYEKFTQNIEEVLSNKETATYITETMHHILTVGQNIAVITKELNTRRFDHDDSKFSPEEADSFIRVTPRLKSSTYGSEEYKANLREIQPALNHHYQNNRHHPEHFPNGVNGMNLIDVTEMVCDWVAAVKRHDDGDVYESLKINRERFNLSDQLYNIIKNTVDYLEENTLKVKGEDK